MGFEVNRGSRFIPGETGIKSFTENIVIYKNSDAQISQDYSNMWCGTVCDAYNLLMLETNVDRPRWLSLNSNQR